jgi:hypothetical protein
MAIGYRWHATWLSEWPMAVFLARGRRRAAGPRLAKYEHPLLQETDTDGGQYVATERALYRHGACDPAWQRTAWIDVATVEHSRATRLLTLRRWPEAESPAIEIPVRDRSRLSAFALERVTACQIITRRVDVTEGCAITITAQLEAGASTATWTVRLDRGCHRDDPVLKRAVDRILGDLRRQTGC